MARHLDAKICGAEMCYLGAMSPGADPQGPKMSLSLPGAKRKFSSKIGPNCKKSGHTTKNKLSWFMSIRMNSSFYFFCYSGALKVMTALEKIERISEHAKMVYLCRRNTTVGRRQGNGRRTCCAVCTAGMRRHKGRQKIIEGGCKMLQKKVGS